MTANRNYLVAVAVCAAAVSGLAGCAGDDDRPANGVADATKAAAPRTSPPSKSPAEPIEGLPAQQIAERAADATKEAESVRAAGTVVIEGERGKVDFVLTKQGECAGTLKMQDGTAEVVQVGKTMYMKADEQFWRMTAEQEKMPPADTNAMVELLKGRWLKVPAEGATAKEMGGVGTDTCDLDGLLDDQDANDRKGLTKGKPAEVNGRQAVTLVKKAGEETTTYSVAAEGEPYYLKVVRVGGDEPGSIVLSEFNEPVDVKAPPADEVVDVDKLGALGFMSGTG